MENKPRSIWSWRSGAYAAIPILCLVVLELTLRDGVQLFTPIPKNITTRTKLHVILTVGESTTVFGGENSYPSQLQRFLDNKAPGCFSVWNGGKASSSTDDLLALLPELLKTVNPDITIFMMGINDRWGLNRALEKSQIRKSVEARIGEIRFLKLLDLIRINYFLPAVGKTVSLEEAWNIPAYTTKDAANTDQSPRVYEYWKLARESIKSDPRKALKIYADLAKTSKNLPANLYDDWANLLLQVGDEKLAERVFGDFLRQRGDSRDYSSVAGRLLEHDNWNSPTAYQHVKPYLDKALNLNPKNTIALWLLGNFYALNQGPEYENKAVELFKRALELQSKNAAVYLALAKIENKRGHWNEAESLLREGLKTNDLSTPHVWRELEQLLISQHREKEVEELHSRRREVAGFKYWTIPETMSNYRRAIEIVNSHGSSAWILHYPEQNDEALKTQLKDLPGTHFPPLYESFHQVVVTHAYEDLFVDRFAESFGHFSTEGARIWAALLGENLLAEYGNCKVAESK